MLAARRAIFSVLPLKRRTFSSRREIWASWCLRSRSRWSATAVPLGEESRVVPPVGLDPRILEGEDRGDGLVEQGQVVGDDEKGAPVAGEVLDEPALGVDVEVVGRLVEEQDVGVGEEDAGELDAPALAARHRRHRPVEVVHAEVGGGALRLGLGGVAALGLELVGEPGESVDRLVAGVRRRDGRSSSGCPRSCAAWRRCPGR